MRYVYPARLDERSGTVLVRFRDLPEAITEGHDRADAIGQAVDCLDVALLFRLKDGEAIPAASRPRGNEILIAATPTVAAKVAFIRAFRDAGLTRTVMAERLGIGETEVRRMLDPNHRTKMDRLDAGLRVLGRRLIIADEAADAA